jgi:hypothetical protein
MQLASQHNGLQYLLSRTAACGEDCYRAQLAMVLISAFFYYVPHHCSNGARLTVHYCEATALQIHLAVEGNRLGEMEMTTPGGSES